MKTIDIRVNEELIMKYGPCLDGLDNFKKHYKDISLTELINSKKINYEHKVWLLKKIVPSELLVLWSIDSAFAANAYSATTTNGAVDATNSASCASRAAYYAYYVAHAYYASEAADYATYYAAGNASEAAKAADCAADYAIRASRYVDVSVNDAKKERLQALLYLIETEEEH